MSRTLTLAGYAVIAATAGAYELATRFGLIGWGATLGDAFSSALRRPAGRIAVLSWWLWIGWHFFVRSHVG